MHRLSTSDKWYTHSETDPIYLYLVAHTCVGLILQSGLKAMTSVSVFSQFINHLENVAVCIYILVANNSLRASNSEYIQFSYISVLIMIIWDNYWKDSTSDSVSHVRRKCDKI